MKERENLFRCFNLVMPVLIQSCCSTKAFILSFQRPSMGRRLKNCIRESVIPKSRCGRRSSFTNRFKRNREIHAQTVDIINALTVYFEGTIGGYVVAGIDGVELFSSTKKSCPGSP